MIKRVYHAGINVRDIGRSTEFYEWLGFAVEARGNVREDRFPGQAKMFGLTDFELVEYAIMHLPGKAESFRLDICQFIQPPTCGEAPSRINQVGIARLCLHADDIDEMYAKVLERGVPLYQDCGMLTYPMADSVLKIFMFLDPDGIVLEVMNFGDTLPVSKIMT